MRHIRQDNELLEKLRADPTLAPASLSELTNAYEQISERFHAHFSCDQQSQHENAVFHKQRYLSLLNRPWRGRVLDVGNDKPFLSYFLRWFNPASSFSTISYEIPESPFALWEVDIERETFPFDSETFDHTIFTEVIEHLWRDPSACVAEINRVTRTGGKIFLTTPNPCDRHSLVCILWQANPNQRSQYFATLESGHLHLWTVADARLILESHGYQVEVATTEDLYGHTKHNVLIEEFIARISPHRAFMNETVVVEATKIADVTGAQYPLDIYPDGCSVQFSGALTSFAMDALKK